MKGGAFLQENIAQYPKDNILGLLAFPYFRPFDRPCYLPGDRANSVVQDLRVG